MLLQYQTMSLKVKYPKTWCFTVYYFAAVRFSCAKVQANSMSKQYD